MWTYQKPANASSISAEHNWKLTCQQSAYNEAGVKLENGQKEGIFPCTCTNSREASWKMLVAVICTELSQKHHVRWVWRHKGLSIHSLICLLTQRMVIRNPLECPLLLTLISRAAALSVTFSTAASPEPAAGLADSSTSPSFLKSYNTVKKVSVLV